MAVSAHGVTVVRAGGGRPELSILMPLYRRPAYVAAAVSSVLAQRGVTAEVIISDDNSGDGTLDRALEVVSAYTGPHRVVVRRGRRRLWRNHMPLLVDLAGCDIVMQAHDDDLSHPARARTVLDVMARTGAVLVGSEADTIDEFGAVTEDASGAVGEHRLVSVDEVLGYPITLIGARLAWKRSALDTFGGFDTTVSVVGQDRLLAIRGALAGPVAIARGPVLANRRHPGNWSWDLADGRSAPAAAFGAAVGRLSLIRGAQRDLTRARRLGLVGDSDERDFRALIEGQRAECLARALDAHDELMAAGRLPLWVDKDELALANSGNLLRELRTRVARTRALVGPAARLWRAARSTRPRRSW